MTRLRIPARTGLTLAVALGALAAGAAPAAKPAARPAQPVVETRTKPVITRGALRFRDLDGNGTLTPYEDWRLTPEVRARDLLSRMTLAEKIGQMVHGTLPGRGGAIGQSAAGYDLDATRPLIDQSHISSFITRVSLPPRAMAEQSNAVQALAEATRLGIPLTISTDPRNHFRYTVGATESANGVTQWPELMGFAALRDPALVRRFAAIARAEYRAVGLHMALSPQLDLASEPRWSRMSGTMGADPVLTSQLGAAYVAGFQGSATGLAPNGVMTVAKHWVGYSALPGGFDSHSWYGRTAHLTTAQLQTHVAAFRGALAARTGGIMPTYPIIAGPVIGGKPVEPVAAGYSKVLLTDLLRGQLGYRGIVLSDWGITSDCNERCRNPTAEAPQRPQDIGTSWGVEGLTVPQRMALGIAAGIDQFGGTHDVASIAKAVADGQVSEARIDQSVLRLLTIKFRLGLFENPYVDPATAERIAADPANRALAARTQRDAQVLLTDHAGAGAGSGAAGNSLAAIRASLAAGKRKVWLAGLDAAAATRAGLTVVATPAEADFALIRTETPSEVLHPYNFFGGRQREGRLDFRKGDPAFDALQAARAAGKPAVFSIFLDRAAILTNIVPDAAAVIATFGATDDAVLDVVLGKASPRGRLPFELPSSMAAVEAQDPAVPDDSARPLFARGAGIVGR